MPPLDFPSSNLTIGQLFAGPNNVQWQWDGQKWLGTPNTLGPIIVAASPPTFQAGQLWWDSTGGNLYLAYDDSNTQQWVPATNVAGLANAATTMDVDKALGNVGRNLIHNSAFTIAQRGAGPFSTNTNTLDRWANSAALDTISVTQGVAADSDRTGIGDEEVRFFLANTFTGNAGAAAYSSLIQRIENIRRLAGKTVLISFWARAASGTPKLGINLRHAFGTGGSPSANYWVLPTGNSVTLSTTWTRYNTVVAIPSVTGKTVGTGGDDSTGLGFWFSSGSDNTAFAGNIGVQSGTVQLWGIQCEIVQPGQTVPTKLEKRDPVLELQQCQRFYQASTVPTDHAFNSWAASAWMTTTIYFKTQMRAVPVVNRATVNLFNITSDGPQQIGVESWVNKFTATAAGATSIQQLWWTASADL